MEEHRERTYEWSDPATTMREFSNRSGLDVLSAMVAGDLPRPPMAATLDFQLVDVGEGTARFEVTAADHHLNPAGGVHGGLALTLIDSATGVAVHTLLDAGVGYGTVDLSTSLVRPIRPGMRLACTAEVLHRGRQIMTARAELRDADGALYAHGTATCMILRPPSTGGTAAEPRH